MEKKIIWMVDRTFTIKGKKRMRGYESRRMAFRIAESFSVSVFQCEVTEKKFSRITDVVPKSKYDHTARTKKKKSSTMKKLNR